jgi:hypothetical protein
MEENMAPLTHEDAARALGEIEQMRARSSRAYGYRAYSPYLILWGAIWAAGQGASLVWPEQAVLVWWALVLGAVAVTCLLPRRPRRANWRIPAVVAIALVFVAAVHAAIGPDRPRLDAAVPPLVIAAIYTGMGLWLGLRFAVAGLVLAACVLAGTFFLDVDLRSWIGFAGGGALILAGLWLRKV